MKTGRNKVEMGYSSQNIKDVPEMIYKNHPINLDDEIHLPRIERDDKVQETLENREADQPESRWVSSTPEKPRKRAGSSSEETQKNAAFSTENSATTISKSGLSQTARSFKTPLKDLQTENFINSRLRGGEHPKDFRNSAPSIGQIMKEYEVQSTGPNKTPDSENKGSRVLNRRSSEEGRLSILRRDTDQTIEATTLSTMYGSQGREINSMYSKSTTQMTSSPKGQQRVTFNQRDFEDPVAHHDSPIERHTTTDNNRSSALWEGKLMNGRQWRKEAPKKRETRADLSMELTSKVTLIRDKKHTFGKFTLTRPSNLQRLDRPSSNLREHIRREEVRYSQHQSETKRMLFERWLKSTNQYLFQLNDGSTQS